MWKILLRQRFTKTKFGGNWFGDFPSAWTIQQNWYDIAFNPGTIANFLQLFGGSIYYPRLCWYFTCNVVLGCSIDYRSKSPKGTGAASWVWYLGTSPVASSKSIIWPWGSGKKTAAHYEYRRCMHVGTREVLPSYHPYKEGLPLFATRGRVQ